MGRAFARALAVQGANVVVHCHGQSAIQEAEETGRLVREQGVRAIVVACDLTDLADIRRLFDEAINTFGHVDIVINTAGLIIKKPFVDVTEEDFDLCIAINAKAALFVMQEAARRIADDGRIIKR
jgi:NAD(P)-dependent dehydrogenase (short-subunit alcohol dehydrogenase family)